MSTKKQETKPANMGIMLPEISEKEINALVRKAQSVAIIDQADYDFAAEVFRAVAKKEKEVEADYKKPKSLLNELKQWVLDSEKKHRKPLQDAKSLIAGLLGEWDEKKEREQRIAQQKLEAAAQKQAEKERQREVKAAEKSGASAEEVEAIAETPLAVARVIAPPTFQKAAGVSSTEYWSAEVISLQATVKAAAEDPRFLVYLQHNMVTANSDARSQKALFKVPGLRAVSRRSGTVRT